MDVTPERPRFSGIDEQHATPTRLSESVVWQLQAEFYDGEGSAAWGRGGVPYHITNSPILARSVAGIVTGFLRDCAREGHLDVSEGRPRVHVVELGAGAGRFAYLAERAIRHRMARAHVDADLVYVATDVAEGVLDDADRQPLLRPPIEAGSLDLARFDIGRPDDLDLRHSGTTLRPGSLRHPVVVVANYVLDSVPTDRFVARDGGLYESLVRLQAGEASDRRWRTYPLAGLGMEFEEQPAPRPYYGVPALDRILDEYRDLDEATLLFPVAAIGCLDWFARLTSAPVLVVSSDMSVNVSGDFWTMGSAEITHHGGAIAATVNNHALRRFVEIEGGFALHSWHDAAFLDTSAFVLGADRAVFSETGLAFDDAVEHGGPDEFHQLWRAVKDAHSDFTLKQLLALFRLSDWDARLFAECFPRLVALLPDASAAELREVLVGVRLLHAAHYRVSGEPDVPFLTGTLLYGLGDHAGAEAAFRTSLDHHGDDAATAYNVAACRRAVGDALGAIAWTAEARRIDPDFSPTDIPGDA